MRIEQRQWTASAGWQPAHENSVASDAQLVVVMGSVRTLRNTEAMAALRSRYAHAHLFGCSTAGEIAGERIYDDTIVTTALAFEHTTVRCAHTAIGGDSDSAAAGQRLGEQLQGDDLVHVLLLADGLKVNGSQLVDGLSRTLPPGVAVTGGLAGDDAAFVETLVVTSDGPKAGQVAAIGLYGTGLSVGYASLGGYDQFGPERLITKSSGNVLYELDGQSALGLYKRYLGDHAAGLPASAFLFPLSVRQRDDEEPLVRTVLGVDEATQSMTFAGDMPLGAHARLMKVNFDRLIDGATVAAQRSTRSIVDGQTEFALLISCVGRRLVLKQRTEEEIEAVRHVVGPQAAMAGFYSYGEISPFTPEARCRLHNQTMTVTTLAEHSR